MPTMRVHRNKSILYNVKKCIRFFRCEMHVYIECFRHFSSQIISLGSWNCLWAVFGNRWNSLFLAIKVACHDVAGSGKRKWRSIEREKPGTLMALFTFSVFTDQASIWNCKLLIFPPCAKLRLFIWLCISNCSCIYIFMFYSHICLVFFNGINRDKGFFMQLHLLIVQNLSCCWKAQNSLSCYFPNLTCV